MRTMRRLMTQVAVVVAMVFGAAACQPQKQAPFGFNPSGGGKADGVALLSDADIARIDAAFSATIQKGEAEVARLESEIAKLEADAQRKQSEIDSLVSQIDARKAEIERDFRAQLALGIGLGLLSLGIGSLIAGAGAAASLAVALNSDSRLQQCQRDLDQARAQQSAMRTQAQQYQTKKAAITKQLETIRASKQRLLAALAAPAAPDAGVALAKYPSATAPHRRWRVMQDVVTHVRAEVAALTELRNAAAELVAALDEALAVLHQLADDADRLAQETRDDFFTILEGALTGDPLAIATQWLSGQIAKKTQEILTELGVPYADFVAHLVRTRFTGTPEELDALAKQLLDKLASEILDEIVEPETPPAEPQPTPTPATPEWTWSATNTQSQPIEDESLTSSTLSGPASGVVTRVEVKVNVTHSYVGDLVLMVGHGDQIELLTRQTDDLASELHETFVLTQFAGQRAEGDWELLVSDEMAGDVGTLDSWTLTLSAQ